MHLVASKPTPLLLTCRYTAPVTLHLLLGHPEVLYYEILPHGGIAAHEEVEHLVHAVLLGKVHLAYNSLHTQKSVQRFGQREHQRYILPPIPTHVRAYPIVAEQTAFPS